MIPPEAWASLGVISFFVGCGYVSFRDAVAYTVGGGLILLGIGCFAYAVSQV